MADPKDPPKPAPPAPAPGVNPPSPPPPPPPPPGPPPPAATGTTPAKTPSVDEALDTNTALVYSPKAPLAGNFSPTGPTPPPDPDQVRKDDRAVWAFVPTGFDLEKPELLVYFHGHNYFVTATLNGSTIVARGPDWIPNPPPTGGDFALAKAKGNVQGPAGSFYKFNALDPSLPHHPLVLLPEDGHHAHDLKAQIDPTTKQPVLVNGKPVMVWDGFWCKEGDKNAAGVTVPKHVGTLANDAGLGDMIDNVFDRLSSLAVNPPNGKNYLGKKITSANLKRFFLTGHSGGGVPLDQATVSKVALTVPTTIIFLDATYYDYRPEVRKFCETWSAKSHLGNGKDDSNIVIVYNPASGTEGWKTTLVAELTNKAKQVFPVVEVNHTGAASLPAIENAIKTNPIVVIKTSIAHDVPPNIPQVFVPLVMKNTAA